MTISANEDSLAYPPQLDARLAVLSMMSAPPIPPPPRRSNVEFDKLTKQTKELLSRWDDLQRGDLAAFRKLTSEASLSSVVVPPAGQAAAAESTEAH